MTPDLSTNRVLRLTARVFQIVVAIVILLAAGLKALDPLAFSEQIKTYDIFPHLSLIAAWCFIIFECLLAAALITNLYPRVTALLGMLLMIFFIGITAYAISTGVTANCGCFGNLVHRSPQQVIVEDALMFLALLFSFLVFVKHRPGRPVSKILVVACSGALMAGITASSYSLPVDGLVTELKVGKTFTSWPTEGLYKSLNRGVYLVFLFSLKESSIETDMAMMNALAQNEQLPSCVGLMPDGAAALTTVTFQYAPSFAIGSIEPRFARLLYRRLPRTFILENGVVREVWSRIPIPQEVSLTLSRLHIAVPKQR